MDRNSTAVSKLAMMGSIQTSFARRLRVGVIALALSLAFTLLGGCVTGIGGPVGNYVDDRTLDLRDTVNLSVTYGGFGAKAQLGPLGVGLYMKGEHRPHEKPDKKTTRMPTGELGLVHGELGIHRNSDLTLLVTVIKGSSHLHPRAKRRRKGFEMPFKAHEFGRVGGSAGACLLGVRAEVNVLEIFDFLAGLFGFDPMGDDQSGRVDPAPVR